MPQRVVRADDEHLETPVGVASNHRGIDPPTHRRPVAPPVVRGGLPHMPQRMVRAACEKLQTGTRCAVHNPLRGPHFRVETAASITHPEVSVLSPASSPRVLRDPAAVAVVVSHDANAMPTNNIAGRRGIVAVHASGVVMVEVLIHCETRRHGAHCGYELFHR